MALNAYRTGFVLPNATQRVLDNIQKAYPNRVTVECDGSVRPEWFQIKVSGLTERQLLHDMEQRKLEIFGNNLNEFYVINYLNGKDLRANPGVWLYHLKPEELGSHPSGFWYA
jgi:hypothetical protein